MKNINKKILNSIISLTLLLGTTESFSQSLPDLSNQKSWSNSDKKNFIQFLESGKQIPVTGNVKYISTAPEITSHSHKAKFATLNFVATTIQTVGDDNVRRLVSSNLGAKLLVGGHVFSWVRYYTGLQYNAIDQTMKNGKRARLNHYEFPIGMELALIPLGTPQTRYVILRGGVAAHYIEGNKSNTDFNNSLLGLRGSWNLGLGYEWQIPDTRWRFHALLEGMKSMSKEKGTEFTGLGMTSGVVVTF